MDDLFHKQLIHEKLLVPYSSIGSDMSSYFTLMFKHTSKENVEMKDI